MPGGPVARALSTPLALWLLRKVYLDTQRDPAALTDKKCFPTADAITRHLLDDLVGAALSANPPEHNPDDPDDFDHPFRPRRHWDPGDAQRWLSFLAHHRNDSGTRDLQWWRLHRAVHRRWSTLGGTMAVGLTVGHGDHRRRDDRADPRAARHHHGRAGFGLTGGVTGGLVGGLTAWAAAGAGCSNPDDGSLRTPNLRPKGPRGTLAAKLVFGLSVGLAVGRRDRARVRTRRRPGRRRHPEPGVRAGRRRGGRAHRRAQPVGVHARHERAAADAPRHPAARPGADVGPLARLRAHALDRPSASPVLSPKGFAGLIAAVEAGIVFGIAGGVAVVLDLRLHR